MKCNRTERRGYTLLELVIATAMLATLTTSVSLLLRGTQAAWRAQAQDTELLEAAHATARHVVRHLRQAAAVSAITLPSDAAGSLSALMPNGETYVWTRSSGDNTVRFGLGSATDLLAENIVEMSFAGYQADGVTATTDPEEVQVVECSVKVVLPRDAGAGRTVTCRAWVRSW